MNTEEALRIVLDHVDYMSGACKPTEMIGAALPTDVIRMARATLKPKKSSGSCYYCNNDIPHLEEHCGKK